MNSSREIEREEFCKVMALMRSYHRQGARHRDGRRVGLKVGKSVENGGLLGYFFGDDGKGRLNHDKFVQFLRDLHDEVFSCFCHKFPSSIYISIPCFSSKHQFSLEF